MSIVIQNIGLVEVFYMITKLLNFQQDLEDSFLLDCSLEDVKQNKEAYKLYKKLKKQRKYVDKIKRITEKHIIK